MALLTTAPRGTKDVVPSESYKWQYVESIARKTAEDFGFSEIRFPAFEHTELFLRGIGGTTDVVQKEMYTFEDKGGRSISLRPEGTASVVRSCLENSVFAGGLPVKAYYICPNFRYEKPQAGRLREHHQFGVECFGSAEPSADAEVIALAKIYLERLGLRNLSLEINSIGCPECRPAYHAALREYFSAREDELCETCRGRLERNPMRILDCKSEICKSIAAGAPVMLDYLCDDCREHFERLKGYLDGMGINYTVNPKIVRGLDYYTRTVFEFVSTQAGSQGTVCGGGRYDGLVAELGGQAIPGLGFGSGIERALLVMEAEGVEIPRPAGTAVFLAALGDKADSFVQSLAYELRSLGVAAERDLCARGLKAQMKYADRINARYAIVIGDNEIESSAANIKDMSTGEQTPCALNAEAIAAFINRKE